MEDIKLMYKRKEVVIPNAWERLSQQDFIQLTELWAKVESGQMSIGEMRMRLLCDIMGWDISKIKGEDAVENLLVLSERLTFLFKLEYPDDDAALRTLSDADYAMAKRIDPFHLQHIPTLAHLKNLDYKYRLDLCYFAQLVPELTITISKDLVNRFSGYRAVMSDGIICSSLTALQYIEARQLLDKPESWPLMAAILYYPGIYNSEGAQRNAKIFRQLQPEVLRAVAMNFQAVNTFLYTKTDFSLLAKFLPGKAHAITTDMSDALYDLCADGLGNSHEVEQLNLMSYLKILRKKTIDGVRQLHAAGVDLAKIAEDVGLPIEIITKII